MIVIAHIYNACFSCSYGLQPVINGGNLLALSSLSPKNFDKYLNKKVLYPPERICRMK